MRAVNIQSLDHENCPWLVLQAVKGCEKSDVACDANVSSS